MAAMTSQATAATASHLHRRTLRPSTSRDAQLASCARRTPSLGDAREPPDVAPPEDHPPRRPTSCPRARAQRPISRDGPSPSPRDRPCPRQSTIVMPAHHRTRPSTPQATRSMAGRAQESSAASNDRDHKGTRGAFKGCAWLRTKGGREGSLRRTKGDLGAVQRVAPPWTGHT